MSQAIFYTDDISLVPDDAVALRVGEICDKATLLVALGQACQFPTYYSLNWDSAYDCLTDSEVTALQISLASTDQIDNKDLSVFKTLIEDAYEQFGKPQLWIVSAKNLKI